MNEPRFFFGRLSVYGLATLLDRVGYLLLLPLFIGYFSPAEYGQIAVGMATAALLLNLCDPGLGAGFMRHYDESSAGERPAQFAVFLRGIAVVTLLLVLVALPLHGWYRETFLAPATGPAFYPVILLYVLCNALVYALLIRCRIAGEARHFLQANLSLNLLRLALVYAAVLGAGLGVTGAFWGMLLANALVALALIMRLRGTLACPLPAAATLRLLRRYVAFGLPLAATGLVFCCLELLDRLLLQWLTGDAVLVGIYDFNYKLAALLLLLITPLQMLWPEYIYTRGGGTDQATYRLFVMVLTAGAWLLALFVPYLFLLRPMRAYAAQPGLTGLLALGYALYGLHAFFSVGYHREKKPGYILAAALLALLANVALDLLLIPLSPLTGAALATVIAYAVLLLALARLRHRARVRDLSHRAAWRGLLPWLLTLLALWGACQWWRLPWPADLLLRSVAALAVLGMLARQLLRAVAHAAR